jgi:hypothetical protein
MFDGCIPQKKEPSPFQLLSNIFMQYSGLDGTSIFPVVHCLSHLLPLQSGGKWVSVYKPRVVFSCDS